MHGNPDEATVCIHHNVTYNANVPSPTNCPYQEKSDSEYKLARSELAHRLTGVVGKAEDFRHGLTDKPPRAISQVEMAISATVRLALSRRLRWVDLVRPPLLGVPDIVNAMRDKMRTGYKRNDPQSDKNVIG